MAVTREQFRFFQRFGGGCIGRNALAAINLARAESYADRAGWEAHWVTDSDCDGPHEWGWSEAEIRRWERSSHEYEGCILRDAKGNRLASLWGIWDADASYRRWVEAELALEAWSEEERRWNGCAHFAGGK